MCLEVTTFTLVNFKVQTFDRLYYTKNNNAIFHIKKDTPEVSLFRRFMDDLVRTVEGEPTPVLDFAKSLHSSLQFTLEETNSEENSRSWI